MNRTSGGGVQERKTLADIILGKIAEKEAKERGEKMHDGDEEEDGLPPLPPKVVDVYTDIGRILSRYTSGKLPKAFKVIPSLSNWEQVLYLTRPDQWTPQAMYAATRIFASNLNPKMAQRFYYLVLLDACRTDIYESKKLNYHYYMSLKKAVYKPAAFFKGILLPLCKEECTLREAAIVASVLQRVSIPVHHSAVAIHKLAQMRDYNGAASIFIRTLLNKKYALPVPVISSLVTHFASFLSDDRVLPVLWHQALLVFCERYKNEVHDEARESLRLVMRKHFHPKITPEIRRELFGASAWRDERTSRSAATPAKEDADMVQ
jgi:essential nuclear protein 1